VLKFAERSQRQYLQIRRKIAELKAAGKPIPTDVTELIEDEEEEDAEEEEEDDDDEDTGIEISDDDGENKEDEDDDKAGAGEKKKRNWCVFKRWVKIIRPEGVLIRQDFGASWDRSFRKEGVRITGVVPGSLAARSGLKGGDVIIQALGEPVKTMGDLRKAFEKFKFEKEAEGERAITIDIKRPAHEGQFSEDSVTVRWEPVQPYRVDAKWNRKEKQLNLLVRHAKEATVYMTDEFVKPGEAFSVFINGVPYQDLVDPATRPDYPERHPGMDSSDADRIRRMRRKRAKVEAGWKPDLKFALEDQLAYPDRGCVVGAKFHLDFSKMKEGFDKARAKRRKPDESKGKKLEEAVTKFGGGTSE